LIYKKNNSYQYWKKMGLIIKPQKFFSWDKSHCMIPTPVHLGGDIYRIFFGTRNYKNQSSVTYADINLAEKITVLKYSQMQALKKGKVGAFDDNGVLPSCVIKKKTSFFFVLYWMAAAGYNKILPSCWLGYFKKR
jgi:hypothetical protein